ncbi:MAG: Ldh family oxidoreductase [Candidatus Binatia bacterium]
MVDIRRTVQIWRCLGVSVHFFGAIRVDSFRPADEFNRDMDRLIREFKSTPFIEGQERVYVAGQIEFEQPRRGAERGIPLLLSVLQGLRDMSEQLGVACDLGYKLSSFRG